MAVEYFSRQMLFMNRELIIWEFGRPVYQRLDKLNIKRLLLFIFLYLHIHMEPTKPWTHHQVAQPCESDIYSRAPPQ